MYSRLALPCRITRSLWLLSVLLILKAPPAVAQTAGGSLTPSASLSSAVITNSDPNFTIAYTYTTTWESHKVTSKGLEIGPLLTSSQNTAYVAPGQSQTVLASRPMSLGGASPSKVISWNRVNVAWPYKASEQAAIDAKNKLEQMRQEAEQKKQNASTTSSQPFQTFIARLKRSGKTYDFYPGDPHYGAGYYDQTGNYLGNTDPGSEGKPGRNPGFDRFGPPPSLSNFDKRYPDTKPQTPTYANLLPKASALAPKAEKPAEPGWSFDNRPTTWTDSAGRVLLMEPLPPEYQNLTPEQLGILPDTSWTDSAPIPPMTDEDWDRLRAKASSEDTRIDDIPDLAWDTVDVDFSDPSIGDAAADDIRKMWSNMIANEDPIAKAAREIKARTQAEYDALDERTYLNDSEDHLMYKSIAERKADLIVEDAIKYGFSPPNREEALKQAWQSIGGNYISKERMESWNATADRFGFTDTKYRYKIEEEPNSVAKPEEKTPAP